MSVTRHPPPRVALNIDESCGDAVDFEDQAVRGNAPGASKR